MRSLLLLLVLCPLSGQTRVDNQKFVSTSNNAAQTFSYSATAGRLLICACAAESPSNPQITILGISDGVNTWNPYPFINDKTNGEAVGVFYAFNSTTGTLSIECKSGAPGGGNLAVEHGMALYILAYTGFTASVIGDGSANFTIVNKTTNSGAISIGPIQTANANALLIVVFSTNDTSGDCVTSVGVGWTLVEHNDDATSSQCSGIVEKIVSATGDYTATATVASSKWVAGIMAFIPSGTTPVLARTTSKTVTSSNGWWASAINVSNGATSNIATCGGKQYVAYAAASLAFRIASIDIATGTVTTVNPGLPIWSTSDQHNSASIQCDKNGYVHLTYDMHVTPLIYYRSTAANDVTAFSGPYSMLGGTPETSVTFGMFFKHPTSGEIYYTFHYGSPYGGDQYFYHYNTTSSTWEAAAGLDAMGLFIRADGVFVNSLPRWSSGVLWWSWIPATFCDPVNCANEQHLAGWNGTSFIKVGGAAQSMPITTGNNAAAFLMDASPIAGVSVLNGFSIDSNGTFFLPYKFPTGAITQMYVAENSSGSFAAHTLTNNTIAWNPPNPELWGGETQSPSILSNGKCTYVTYPDIFAQRGGQRVIQSCDNFATAATYLLTTNYNPSWILFQDSNLQGQTGTISFLFEETNDTGMISPLTNFSANLGNIKVIDWNPQGASTLSGNARSRAKVR